MDAESILKFRREWLDQIDLTPGLILDARQVEHPVAGAGLVVDSRCPSGPISGRCAPRGWSTASGASVPKLPKGWTPKKMTAFERHVRSEVDKRVPIASRPLLLEINALGMMAVITRSKLDIAKMEDPLGALKWMGLESSSAAEARRYGGVDVDAESLDALVGVRSYGGARVFVPADRVLGFEGDLAEVLKAFQMVGRPCGEVQALLDGSPLADWRDLSKASRSVSFHDVGRVVVASGEKLWAFDPGCGGGGRVALEPGAYRCYLSRHDGLNAELALAREGADPAIALSAQGWSKTSFHVDVDAGVAGFCRGKGGLSIRESDEFDKVAHIFDHPLEVAVNPWGVVCSSGPGDGRYRCEVLGAPGSPVQAARLVFMGLAPALRARLVNQACALGSAREADALDEQAGAGPKASKAARIKSRL